jgi:signal transduction histidine kinase
LSELCDTYTPKQLNIVVNWLAVGFTVHALIEEVRMSTERISEIVKSVKEYSYLDQAPLQEVDVHEGLNNTLIILRHKIKEDIQISKQYESTPRIEAWQQLNQVWTNIPGQRN